ncbi:mediator complex subunit med10 [Cystoisospora suis]|uniref:Mediator complex subunit med10 n=1 Tax=Cystoisospora suis TaxID=483139 RepID=A0A2C6LBW9_9APIC|nr:mediator complex subunit med10 [Cystoisospora suis]
MSLLFSSRVQAKAASRKTAKHKTSPTRKICFGRGDGCRRLPFWCDRGLQSESGLQRQARIGTGTERSTPRSPWQTELHKKREAATLLSLLDGLASNCALLSFRSALCFDREPLLSTPFKRPCSSFTPPLYVPRIQNKGYNPPTGEMRPGAPLSGGSSGASISQPFLYQPSLDASGQMAPPMQTGGVAAAPVAATAFAERNVVFPGGGGEGSSLTGFRSSQQFQHCSSTSSEEEDDEQHSSLSGSSSDGGGGASSGGEDEAGAGEDEPGGANKKPRKTTDGGAGTKASLRSRVGKGPSREARQRKKAAKLYMKTVHCLTKMTLLLEDSHIVVPVGKAENKASRRLSKLLLRYDRMLVKLEEYIMKSSSLSNASVPSGLLRALDENVDPMDWVQECVVNVHREKNAQLRGVFTAFGSYEATLHQSLRYGPSSDLLPPLPRAFPSTPSFPLAAPNSTGAGTPDDGGASQHPKTALTFIPGETSQARSVGSR